MAIVTYPLNNIEYSAADAEIYNSTRTSGVYANTDNLDVDITGARTISISAGLAWIKNDKFTGKSIAVKEAIELTFDAPDRTLNRIDRVVLRFSATANATTLEVKKGTPASNPTAPAITQTTSVYELGLYDVSIPAGLVSLTTANIIDQRTNDAVCGIMNDGVTRGGSFSTSKTTTLSASWTTATSNTVPSNSVCNFFQTISVNGVTPDTNGMISVSDSATKAQREAATEAMLFKHSQTNGSIVVAGIGDKPTIAIPIEIILMR